MFYTDDPVADFERYDRDKESRLMRYPKCCECCEHIQDGYAYHIGDEWFCEKCMNGFYEEVTEDD